MSPPTTKTTLLPAHRASAFLKAKTKEADISCAELAKRLKKHETEAGITMKLKRGDVRRHVLFYLSCGDGT
jgi:hypothetical protein